MKLMKRTNSSEKRMLAFQLNKLKSKLNEDLNSKVSKSSQVIGLERQA